MSYSSWQKRPPRHFIGRPQWSLDTTYITPFTARRRYDPDGGVHYDPVERNLRPTGINVMDHYLQQLAEGTDNVGAFCKIYGLRVEDLDSFFYILTGMPRADFRLAYQLRLADDLLRYTDMKLADVARRCGLGSHTNLCVMMRRHRHQSPTDRRRTLRQPGDAGRYRM